MAVTNTHLLQTVSTVAEALSSSECRRLSYLCGSLDTDESVASVKEMLNSKVMNSEMDDLFLLELMFELRRFDLLKKVFETSRDEVERTLRHRQVLSRFRVLMDNLSEDMASEDVRNVKFLLTSTLPREKMDKAENFLDVIVELEKLDKVSSEKVDFVEQCLRNIGRIDLARKVNRYQKSDETFQQHSSQQINQQQLLRAPFSYSAPNTSCHLHHPKRGQSHCIASEKKTEQVNREQSFQSLLDGYKLNRGVCVIIDCVGNDGDMLEDTFKALHFSVTLHKWLHAKVTLSVLTDVLSQRENRDADAFICCIISRGTATHLLATDSHSTDLHLDGVRRLFTAEVCPMLAGKPKLFFIQRYSTPKVQACPRITHRDEDLETDGCNALSRCELVPTDADVFWSHCWTDEHHLEQSDHHSVYLKALTDTLRKGQRRKSHLVDIHIKVNEAIYNHNKRNPGAEYHIDLKHTLRKNLYLQ
ncbi:hypothetical protein LDENG_00019280 [Lucifuga dentata]|nr:hypothetical protein LDENG_00019280 [Lucifuga dentata]